MGSTCGLAPESQEKHFELLSKLSRNEDEELSLPQAAAHVRECGPCAREYLLRVLAGEAWELQEAIAGEIAGGPSQPPSGALAELEKTLLAEATRAFRSNTCGVLGLVHTLDERATALEVLARLCTRLKAAGVPARIYAPGRQLNLTAPGPILVPSFEALRWLIGIEPQGRLWVALVPRHSQNRCLQSPAAPLLRMWTLPRLDAFDRARVSFLSATGGAAQGLLRTERQLLDAMCVPGAIRKGLRISQLAKMLNLKPQALDSATAALVELIKQELVNQRLDPAAAEADHEPAFQVIDSKFAAERLNAMSEEQRLELYQAWWRSLQFDVPADRLACYEFVVWLAEGPQRPLVRRFLTELLLPWNNGTREAAQQIVSELSLRDSRELRAWGELLDELRSPVAIALLELALERDPQNPYLLHTLGRCYARRACTLSGPDITRREEYRKAVDCFRQAAANDVARQVAEHSLIELELELGRAAEANRLLGANRDLTQPWWATLYAKIAARLGRPGVLESFQKAEKQDPDNFFFGVMLADFHAERQDYREAIESLNSVLGRHPDHLQALTLKARIYRDRGWLQQALGTLEHVLRQHPENEYALHLSADIYAEKNEWTSANEYYERLEEVDPGNLPGVISRCNWLLRHCPGERTQVEALLPPVNDSLAHHPYVRSIRARLLLAAGQHEQGLEILRELRAESPASAVLRNQLALALARLGRFSEARILMENACRGVIDWNTYARILRLQAKRLHEGGDVSHAERSLASSYECYQQSRQIDNDNLYTLRGILRLFSEWERIKPGVSSEHEGELAPMRRALADGGLPQQEPGELWGEP